MTPFERTAVGLGIMAAIAAVGLVLTDENTRNTVVFLSGLFGISYLLGWLAEIVLRWWNSRTKEKLDGH